MADIQGRKKVETMEYLKVLGHAYTVWHTQQAYRSKAKWCTVQRISKQAPHNCALARMYVRCILAMYTYTGAYRYITGIHYRYIYRCFTAVFTDGSVHLLCTYIQVFQSRVYRQMQV